MLIDTFFRQQATVIPYYGDADGEPKYGSPEIRKCRLERGDSLKKTGGADGTVDAIPCSGLMFCRGEYIPERSIIQYQGFEYVVVECAEKRGFGFSHWEVAFV